MLIRDIHMYCSDMDNVDGYPMPRQLNYAAEQAMASRIALKLREMKFELGDYCDLKLNFTPCAAASTVQHALRTPPSKTVHYVDVGVTRDVYQQLKAGDPAVAPKLIAGVRQALLVLYGPHHEERDTINEAIDEAVSKGADMEFCLQEKQGFFSRAQILVKLLDDGAYRPRLCVSDKQGNIKLDQPLSDMESLDQIREVQIGFGKVTVHYAYGERTQDSFAYKK